MPMPTQQPQSLLNTTISYFYINANGIRMKLPDLYAALCTTHHKVVIIDETWLYSMILDSQFTPPGWVCFRRDRHGSTGNQVVGGVSLFW